MLAEQSDYRPEQQAAACEAEGRRKEKTMKLANHFFTITKHKTEVMKNCFRAGLYYQGLTHDLSKYSPSEFFRGVKYYQGDRSPNDAERMATGVGRAWLHHKGRNKHHFEYWIDYDLSAGGKMAGLEMPVNYLVEMVCDRIAASKIYLGDKYTDSSPLEYYERSKGKYYMNPKTEKLLRKILVMLAEEGEEAVFDYMKYVLVRRDRKNKIKRLAKSIKAQSKILFSGCRARRKKLCRKEEL